MNRFILSTSLALALSGTLALAQQPDAAPTQVPAEDPHHHAHNPQREAARLSKKLNLSPDQTAKLEPILADRDQKLAALNNNTTAVSPVVMRQQMKTIHQQTMQQLAAVLSPDQIQQMKARHHGRGVPAQTQPQPNPQAGL
jgi:periplasmic protein CpxP/Spy